MWTAHWRAWRHCGQTTFRSSGARLADAPIPGSRKACGWSSQQWLTFAAVLGQVSDGAPTGSAGAHAQVAEVSLQSDQSVRDSEVGFLSSQKGSRELLSVRLAHVVPPPMSLLAKSEAVPETGVGAPPTGAPEQRERESGRGCCAGRWVSQSCRSWRNQTTWLLRKATLGKRTRSTSSFQRLPLRHAMPSRATGCDCRAGKARWAANWAWSTLSPGVTGAAQVGAIVDDNPSVPALLGEGFCPQPSSPGASPPLPAPGALEPARVFRTRVPQRATAHGARERPLRYPGTVFLFSHAGPPPRVPRNTKVGAAGPPPVAPRYPCVVQAWGVENPTLHA